jgi:hypothetical protein
LWLLSSPIAAFKLREQDGYSVKANGDDGCATAPAS